MFATPSLLHSSGLNSILFAINIDNSDLNGAVTRGGGPSVSNLLKESTQGIGSLWKESAQGVSSLLREISTATAVVPGFPPRVDGASDPLPVLPRSTSAGRRPQYWIWQMITHNTIQWSHEGNTRLFVFAETELLLFAETRVTSSSFDVLSSLNFAAKIKKILQNRYAFFLIFCPPLDCSIIYLNPPWQMVQFEPA